MKYNILPNYVRPMKGTKEPTFEDVYFNKALEAYDEQEYKEVVIFILKYINEDMAVAQNFEKTLNFHANQGQSRISIKIENDTLFIKASLAKISQKTNKVALYRKVAEINFNIFMLPQIYVKDDILQIKYSCKLPSITPYKIYYAIRSMAVNGDYYFNYFAEKYNTLECVDPKVSHLSEKDMKKVLGQIDDIFDQYKSYAKIFKEKRYDSYQWDNVILVLFKMSNMPYMQGYVKHKIIETINMMYESDMDFEERVEKGEKLLEKLMKKDISKYIFNVEKFISTDYDFSVDEIQEKLRSSEENVKKYLNEDNFLALSYLLQVNFMRLDYDFNLNEAYKTNIQNTLEKVSGLKVDDGAKILHELYEKMLQNEVEDDEESGFSGYWIYVLLVVIYVVARYILQDKG